MEPSPPAPPPCFSREVDGDDDRLLPPTAAPSFVIVQKLKLSCCWCSSLELLPLLLFPLLVAVLSDSPTREASLGSVKPDAKGALLPPPSAVLVLTPLTLSTSVDMVDVDDARVLPLTLAVSGGNLSRGSNLKRENIGKVVFEKVNKFQSSIKDTHWRN